MRVGISVECIICGLTKKPHGRSAPLGSSYCDDDCYGYDMEPKPGCLWPGETEEDFGYKVCDNAVKARGQMAEIPEEDRCDYPNCPKPWDCRIEGMNLCPEHYDEYVSECGKDEN